MTAPKEIRDNYEEVMPGVYAGVPNDLYHSVDGLSKTTFVSLPRVYLTTKCTRQWSTSQRQQCKRDQRSTTSLCCQMCTNMTIE